MLPLLRRALAAALATGMGLALAGCGSDDGPREHGSGTGLRYVALGDSSVAGAGIGATQPPCYTSKQNYPSQVAEALGTTNLVDASCISATTHDVLAPQTTDTGAVVPAQLDAVTADTDLVTIGIGGNDDDLVPQLFTGCYSLQNSAKACRAAIATPDTEFAQIQQSVVGVLDAIKKKAPHAVVVLVGYLRIMPDSGHCDPKVVRISSADLAKAARTEGRLADASRGAAQQAGVAYFDMRKLSVGHDACAGSRDAWVSGATAKAGDGTYLHPRAKGAQAVAKALVPVVRSQLGGSASPSQG